MKNKLKLLFWLNLLIFQQSFAQNPNFQWVQNIGAAASGGYGFSDAKYDNHGNLYVIGQLITLDYTLAQQTNIQWNITDLAGKIVLNGNIDQTSKVKTQIHLNSLADGVYILNIQTPFGNKTEKLVKN